MKTLILMSGLTILASSCGTTQFFNQKYPIIPIPERPSISSDLTEEDFKKMARYAKKLEIGIKEYNEYAKRQNVKIEEHFNNR